jgi:outer membrane protein assembly factor BamD
MSLTNWNNHIKLYGLLSLIIFFTSCATDNESLKSASSGELLQQGKAKIKKKTYPDAQKIFTQLLEDYPDSKERIQGLMLLGDVSFKSKSYDEAKLNYEKFIELYPAHPRVDHAYFYKAMSDFKSTDHIARDQSAVASAIEGFEDLVKTFPKSPYKNEAVIKISQSQKKLAENSFSIGKYYFRTGSYQSAILRFIKLIKTYPKQGFIDEAIYLLGESYYQEQNFNRAKKFFNQLLDKYPQSSYYREARLRLRNIK